MPEHDEIAAPGLRSSDGNCRRAPMAKNREESALTPGVEPPEDRGAGGQDRRSGAATEPGRAFRAVAGRWDAEESPGWPEIVIAAYRFLSSRLGRSPAGRSPSRAVL